MTYEELMRRRMMFQIHSKRNELPKVDTNVPNPNVVKHSATNDYLEFRKKVAAGAKKQRQANTAMFNVTQANEQYYEELASNSIMVHAGTNAMTNEYIAKLDNFYGPGKPRYFYTKEEWEGYQRNKQAASQAGADRGTKQKEEASKIENKSYSTKKMEADINNRVSALNAQKAFANASGGVDPVKAAQNSFTNSENKYKAIEKSKELANDSSRWDKYNNKSGKDAIANVISKDSRFTNIKNPDEAAGYPGGPEKYYNDLEDAIKKELDYQKNASSQAGADRGAKEELNSKESNYRKNATNNSGADRATKEKENAEKEARLSEAKKQAASQSGSNSSAKSAGEAEDSWKKEQAEKKRLSTSGGYQSSKSEGEAQDEWKKEQKAKKAQAEYKKNSLANPEAIRGMKEGEEAEFQKQVKKEEANKKKAKEEYNKNAESAKNAGADRGAKESAEANAQKTDKINKKNWERNAGQKWYADRDRAEKEYINNATNPDDPKLNKLADSFTENGWKAQSKKMNLIIDRQNKNGMSYRVEPAKKKSAKHSSLEDGITTDELTPEQEYLEFRKKVEAGLKHFGQTRGLMSLPVNQALKNGESLQHSTNFKYYNKIELPGGGVRYFYSKEEWDAYNNDVKSSNNEYAKRDKQFQNYRLDYGLSNTAVEERKIRDDYRHKENKGADDQVVKEGFIKKSMAIPKKIANDLWNGEHIPDDHKKAIKKAYQIKMNSIENKYGDRLKKIDPEDYDYPFRSEVRKLDMDDFTEPMVEDAARKMIAEYINNSDKTGALNNSGKIMADMFDGMDKAIDEELTKREKSIEAWNSLRKSYDKYLKTIGDDLTKMNMYDKQILADEMGIDSFNDADIYKKYNLIDSFNKFEPGDDYGASKFEEQEKIVKEFWNDYKEAKKALNSSKKDEDEEK